MDYSIIAIYIVSMIALVILLNIGGWFLITQVIDHIGHRLRFHQFVGIRHLRGPKSGSLTVIGLLTIIAVSFSSCTLTTVLSVMGGFSDDLKQKILSTNPHVIMDNYGVGLNVSSSPGEPSDNRFSDWRKLLQEVQSQPGVLAAAPVVAGEVMLNAKTSNSGLLLRGIDPRRIQKVSAVLDNLETGQLRYLERPDALFTETRGRNLSIQRSAPAKRPSNHDTERDTEPDTELDTEALIPAPVLPGQRELPPLIVGREVAKSLRLYLGEDVKIISPLGDIGPTGPIPKSRPFRIAGSFFSGMYAFDEHYAYTSLKAAQEFLNTGDTINEIHIRVRNPDEAKTIAGQLSNHFEDRLRTRSWQETNAELFSALKLEKIVMFILMSIAILVSSFSIIATLTMLVLEKGPEISVLMTIGASRNDIAAIFRYEGILIGTIGTITGLLVGLILCLTLQWVGLPIPPEVWYIDKLPVDISPVEFLFVGITSLIVTSLATLYPTRVASGITPVEGLKE